MAVLTVTEFNHLTIVCPWLSTRWQDSISLSLFLTPISTAILQFWMCGDCIHNLYTFSPRTLGICPALPFHVNEAIVELAINLLKVVLCFVLFIYGFFVFMVYWQEAYSDCCQIAKIELFTKLVNNWFLHCVKRARVRSYSGPHFPAFSRIWVSLRIQFECGKNADQNNFE